MSSQIKSKQAILKKALALHALYRQGKIPTLAQHEIYPDVPKGSRENYLYFTMASCLNFQRSSPQLWSAAFKTYVDRETNYLFFPELVAQHSREQIQHHLLKHRLALQPNKHTDIWLVITQAFHELYDNDPRQLLNTHDFDVVKIHRAIQHDQRQYFPYLSGPKMANYWLYILSRFTDVSLKNMHELSIIPDIHVLQSTVKLGLTPTTTTPVTAAQLWKELLADSGIAPVEMHPVLWNWSRNNFQPEV